MTETPGPPAPFVTLAELATFLNAPQLADGDRAELLQETLDAALENVADAVGPLDGVAVEVLVWPSGRSLVVPDTHLVSVNRIIDPGGAELDPPQGGVNHLAGVIEFPRPLARGEWLVEYQAREHADSVKLAVKIIASHLWEVQRGTGDGVRGRVATPMGDPQPTGRGFAIPARAAELLRPFKRPRGIG